MFNSPFFNIFICFDIEFIFGYNPKSDVLNKKLKWKYKISKYITLEKFI